MNTITNPCDVKYEVEIHDVREVTLLGAADLAYWAERLSSESLHPTNRDGRALLLLCAVDAKFMGLQFRELSISVFVSRREDGAEQDGAFLIHAFNSRRCFAWVERTLFHTPYHFARLRVDPVVPASWQLSDGGGVFCAAKMGCRSSLTPRVSVRQGDDGWAGPIFLPGNTKGDATQGRVFFARIGGPTQVFQFEPGFDELVLQPTPDVPVLQSLIDSRLAIAEWHIRVGATHGKSKTVRRRAVNWD